MQRRRLIMSGAAILVFGVSFAAQRTAENADRSQVPSPDMMKWRPGSVIPMSAYERGGDAAGPPR